MGANMVAKLMIVKRKLNTISPFSFSHRSRNQKPIDASTPPKRQPATIFMFVTTTEKIRSFNGSRIDLGIDHTRNACQQARYDSQ